LASRPPHALTRFPYWPRSFSAECRCFYDLLRKLLKREFGSDLLGGISIVTSLLLGEFLAGSIIVLMLAGGEALENYALRSASSVLAALAA
jgi:cation transport ATPase